MVLDEVPRGAGGGGVFDGDDGSVVPGFQVEDSEAGGFRLETKSSGR